MTAGLNNKLKRSTSKFSCLIRHNCDCRCKGILGMGGFAPLSPRRWIFSQVKCYQSVTFGLAERVVYCSTTFNSRGKRMALRQYVTLLLPRNLRQDFPSLCFLSSLHHLQEAKLWSGSFFLNDAQKNPPGGQLEALYTISSSWSNEKVMRKAEESRGASLPGSELQLLLKKLLLVPSETLTGSPALSVNVPQKGSRLHKIHF